MERPDRELVSRILNGGDEAAFRLLHDRHTPRLLRVARNLLADSTADPQDLVQESWIRAARRLNRFEWRSSLSTWLCGILINLVREEHRRQDRAWVVELNDDVGPWPDPPDPVERLELERAIAGLPPGGRAVLVLHDVEGYTHQEIGEFLGISPGTSKSQLCRARRSVKDLLSHHSRNVPYVRT